MRSLLCASLLFAGLFAGLFLSASSLRAQPATGTATLEGTVVNAETGEPLEDVNVFIATSLKGTATDAAGRYRLEDVPLGAQRIYVSYVGFKSVARDTLLREERAYTFDVALQTEVLERGEVTVEAEQDEQWQQRLQKFERLFIGETPNAAKTEIMNPEVLSFTSKVGRFTARAAETLVIENRALGYRIRYFLKEFTAIPNRTMYDGEPLFEKMTPDSPGQAAVWAKNRREAFLGSFRHYMLAVLDGKAEERGFKTYSVPAQRGVGGGGPFGRRNALAGNRRFPLDPQEIIEETDVPNEYTLDFQGFVQITYTGEIEDESYLAWRNATGRRPKFRTSRIQLENGPTVVDYKGDVLDPYGVTFYGYLAFERVADEVPKEYRPGQR